MCSRGKLTVFTVLCEQYQPSLRRDPMYNEVRGGGRSGAGNLGGGGALPGDPVPLPFQYLDRIGQLFFGVPPKQTSSYGGLLGKAQARCTWVGGRRAAMAVSPLGLPPGGSLSPDAVALLRLHVSAWPQSPSPAESQTQLRGSRWP